MRQPQPEPFAVIQHAPRSMYRDLDIVWEMLHQIWDMKLTEFGGSRAPGPLQVKVMGFGVLEAEGISYFIPGSLTPMSESSPLWTLVTFRVYGYAFPPMVPPDEDVADLTGHPEKRFAGGQT